MSRPLSDKPGRALPITAYAANQSALATPSIDPGGPLLRGRLAMRRALLARIEKTHVRMPFFGHLQINVAAR
jgi:transcription initiation factor TFIID subunit TAF12